MQEFFGTQMNQMQEALSLHSSDIFYWLNKAQERFVKERFSAGLESTQMISDDLQKILIRNYQLSLGNDSVPMRYDGQIIGGFHMDSIELPTDHFYLVSARTTIQVASSSAILAWNLAAITNERQLTNSPSDYRTLTVPCRQIQSDDLYAVIQDPFNTTRFTSPLALTSNGRLQIITSADFVAKKVFVDYLKKPRTLVQANPASGETTTCDLAEHTHFDIVQLAVDLFLQNTRDLKQRLQMETPSGEPT